MKVEVEIEEITAVYHRLIVETDDVKNIDEATEEIINLRNKKDVDKCLENNNIKVIESHKVPSDTSDFECSYCKVISK